MARQTRGLHVSRRRARSNVVRMGSVPAAALAQFPQVRLVLSSSWCVWPGFGKTLKRLPPSLRDRFIDGTYHQRIHGAEPWAKASFKAMSRGQQVCADALRRKPMQWLALDDETEDWPTWALANLVACDGATGLSNQRVQVELRKKLGYAVAHISTPKKSAQPASPAPL